jgi:hypothetical protein
MRGTEPAFDAFDLNALGIDQERLAFAQRQRVAAFLADSAHYLGLTGAGGEQRRQGNRARVALPSEAARISAGVQGC